MKELNNDRRSSCLWLPRKLSNHMNRQALSGDTVLVKSREMTDRSTEQTEYYAFLQSSELGPPSTHPPPSLNRYRVCSPKHEILQMYEKYCMSTYMYVLHVLTFMYRKYLPECTLVRCLLCVVVCASCLL